MRRFRDKGYMPTDQYDVMHDRSSGFELMKEDT